MYKVKIDSGDLGSAFSILSKLIREKTFVAVEGVDVYANSAYYESPEHFAHALNSMFEEAGVEARAHPWYNEA